MVPIINNKIILVLISGFLTGLTQHFSFLGFVSWFSLVPLLIVLMQLNSYKEVIKYSFIWAFVYNIISVYWISLNIGTVFFVGCISMFLTVLVLSVNTILVGVVWLKIKKYFDFNSLFIFPLVWVSIDYIKTYGTLGFPWISLANTQTNYLYLIQNAEIVGIYGITFWVVLVNCLILALFYNRTNIYILLSVLLFPFISGFLLYSRIDIYVDESFQVSLIQSNIALNQKNNSGFAKKNLDNLIEKSLLSVNNGSQLIIWPESALPYYNLQNPITVEYISKKILYDKELYLLSGDITYLNEKIYNSSVLVNNKEIKNVYHKQQLVPMGEYVPFSNTFDFLNKINFGQTNFSHGTEDVIFNINNHRFSSLICFESTFPDINRRHANKGADFFVYLVNDGWYTSLPEPRQHAKQSIYRAIENRKSVLRCANTGLSMIVSPLGIVEQQTELNQEDIITTFISKTNTITFYTKYGNIFVYLTLIITMILFLYSIYRDEDNS